MGSAVTFIKTFNPFLCRQKEFVRSYTNDALLLILLILLPPIIARLFSIAAPFPALFILTIFLDKCQMKSFEDIHILLKVKLFL